MNYADFLNTKRHRIIESGFEVDCVGDYLYDWQQHVVKWALKKGRAALFADCGLGKTPMQLTWAKHVYEHTGKPVLILAPLAVSNQTKREGEKFGIDVNVCRDQDGARDGINIANYEMLHHFDAEKFGALVLDESSILKNFDGTYRKLITRFAAHQDYRLACTATPAPNDLIEIINHSDFLGVMGGKEVIALFFRQDGNTTHNWRLKGHARRDFWAWLAGWAMAIRYPSDLGYMDGDFILPKLSVTQHTVIGKPLDGMLLPVEAQTLEERRHARKETVEDRVALCAELVNNSTAPWVVWCNLNSESEALAKAIPDAVEVKGSDTNAHKENSMLGFSDGKHRVIVTKPSICGFGMNWQHCSHMAFVGLSDSWEQYYQAIRRCWRFGQTRNVEVHVIVAETEGAVVANIERKERQATEMMSELVAHMKEFYRVERKDDAEYVGCKPMQMPAWLTGEKNASMCG